MKLLNPPRLKAGDYIQRGEHIARVKYIVGKRIICDPEEGEWVVDSDGLFEWEGEYVRNFVFWRLRFGAGLYEAVKDPTRLLKIQTGRFGMEVLNKAIHDLYQR